MDDIQQRIVVQRADTSRPALSRRPRSGRDVLRNSIISVLTQCESDFIPNDPAPLKLAQYCRKQENTLQKKKNSRSRGEENEDGMPGANRADESRHQYASTFAL